MKIAVEGCMHGELDRVYDTIKDIETREKIQIDLLLCCGDFQSTRNLPDLKCMAVPDKYKDVCTFYKYYSGQKTAPILTLFVGGNHESSNYLQELHYGGWVAPNIYYLGNAGVVDVNGLRIGGLSGIYKGIDYLKGHFEKPPYDQSSMRSVYHVRNLECFRLKQLVDQPPDIMLSHDWPRGVYHHGDLQTLIRLKPFLKEDIDKEVLGSRPAQDVLNVLRPKFWFAAHLHVKFAALVDHGETRKTKFLALDKCLPKRRFLQVFDAGPVLSPGQVPVLSYDPCWLSILRSTNHLLSVDRNSCHMPGPGYMGGRWDFCPSKEEIAETVSLFQPCEDTVLRIPSNFCMTAPAFDPLKDDVRQLYGVRQPEPGSNPQTETLCRILGIDDPLHLVRGGKRLEEQKNKVTVGSFVNDDEKNVTTNGDVTDDWIETPRAKILNVPPPEVAPGGNTSNLSKGLLLSKMNIPPPKYTSTVEDGVESAAAEEENNEVFFFDTSGTRSELHQSNIEDDKEKCCAYDESSSSPPVKKLLLLKRRNAAIYATSEDE